MDKDEIELIDYLRVVWKRKILVIVGTLVCIVVVWLISLLRVSQVTEVPEMYRAEALISIGQISKIFSIINPGYYIEDIDNVTNLKNIIPVKYGLNEYSLKAEASGFSLVKVYLEGSDGGMVKELLKGAVNRLLEDHHRITEISNRTYRALIDIMETKGEIIQKNIAQEGAMLEEMTTEVSTVQYHLRKDLWEDRKSLIANQQGLIVLRSVADHIKDHKTKMIGGINVSKLSIPVPVVHPNGESNKVAIAGVVGLIMFLLLAFLIEYLEKVKEKERGKKDASV